MCWRHMFLLSTMFPLFIFCKSLHCLSWRDSLQSLQINLALGLRVSLSSLHWVHVCLEAIIWFSLSDILLYTFGYSITEVAQAIRQARSLVKSLTEGRWSKTILEIWLRLSWLNSTLPSRQDSSRLFDIKLGTWYLGGSLPMCHALRR